MKKTLFYFAAAALSLAACTKTENTPGTEQNDGTTNAFPVTVMLNGPVTRSDAENPETKINSLQIAVYRVVGENKEFESYYSFDPAAMSGTIYIDKSKPADKYLIAAYANQETMTLATITEDWSLFSNEKSGDFQMYGEWFKPASELGSSIPVQLARQCSKITVSKVSLDWTNSANNNKTFKLKSMFLMDAEGVFANIHAIGSGISTEDLWFNKNGYRSGDQDNLLYSAINSIEVTEKAPYTASNTFYGYISDLSTYNDTEVWKPSGTRLVVEADFDGKTCYYAIPLKKEGVTTPYRNKHFIFDNIVITKPGADKPYNALVDETDVKVTLSVSPWDEVNHGQVTIR